MLGFGGGVAHLCWLSQPPPDHAPGSSKPPWAVLAAATNGYCTYGTETSHSQLRGPCCEMGRERQIGHQRRSKRVLGGNDGLEKSGMGGQNGRHQLGGVRRGRYLQVLANRSRHEAIFLSQLRLRKLGSLFSHHLQAPQQLHNCY